MEEKTLIIRNDPKSCLGCADAYDKGYTEGYNTGYADGLKEGRKVGRKDIVGDILEIGGR